MFKNVGRKIRGVAIVFFILLCIASFLVLAAGIINGVMLGWAWPVIGGVIGAAVGFVISLVATYMIYGYGTLIKSCEENARINAEILAILRNGYFNSVKPAQSAQPVQAPQAIREEPEKVEKAVADEADDVKLYEAACRSTVEEAAEEPAEETVEEPAEEIAEEIANGEAVEKIAEARLNASPFAEACNDVDLFSDFVGEEVSASPNNGEQYVKRCPSCGNIVRPQANFCNQCGCKMK